VLDGYGAGMARASVRAAHIDDVERIAAIQASTWHTAYRELLPPDFLAGLDEAELGRAWASTVEAPEAVVLVAVEGDATVGFCLAGRAADEDAASAGGEVPADAATTAVIANLLVEPRWGRRGHGGRLLATAVAELRHRGGTAGLAWIPEADTSSLSFYESVGWHVDGTVRTLDAAGLPLREIRCRGGLDLRLRDG
jgi:GNAT superfamily N-acetyltransferase